MFSLKDEIGIFTLNSDFKTETSIGEQCVIRMDADSRHFISLGFSHMEGKPGDGDYIMKHNHFNPWDRLWTTRVGCIPDNWFMDPCLTLIVSGDRKVIFVGSVDGSSPVALLDWQTGRELTWDTEEAVEFLKFVEQGLCQRCWTDDYVCPEQYSHIRPRVVSGNCRSDASHIVRINAIIA